MFKKKRKVPIAVFHWAKSLNSSDSSPRLLTSMFQILPADGCLNDKGDISLLEGFKEYVAKIEAQEEIGGMGLKRQPGLKQKECDRKANDTKVWVEWPLEAALLHDGVTLMLIRLKNPLLSLILNSGVLYFGHPLNFSLTLSYIRICTPRCSRCLQ